MPRYLAMVDMWVSHESRLVKAGTEFETVFPLAQNGQPMRLGANLQLVKADAKKGPFKPDKEPDIA
jgi:hypothetical protein